MIKLLLCVLASCLASTLVSSAPTDDASTTSATTGQNEPRAAAGGANMVDAHAHLANSSFTCYNRQVGYYADVDTDCKVYHFCLLGLYNNEQMYQRISYMCLNDTTFDQQALDCVESSKVTAPCKDSTKFYDDSNAALRRAVVGQASMETEKKEGEKKEEDKKEEDKKEEDKKEEDKKEEQKTEKKDEKEEEKDKKDD